ncbi:DJ-1/PfpI family protein [Ammoniphilus resinae]|uniref:Intracellular protease/amidase n=1 Tax=Ammoniphilus resinae TaxID=861532 RepID=A0ABS4GW57_9BACL|nr:DJ-1/PfpI family protein [Ammoniphilus resinae]MBP1934509.1 putative intracellular protease/amidase [Ammoniphilus resinae]
MKKLVLRFVVYVLSFVVIVGGIGAFGMIRSQGDFYGAFRTEPIPAFPAVEKPLHDLKKPTVAVLLGNETTEGSDFAIPYELFSRTGEFNVYAVASDNQVRTLTGGLEVVPHYSFAEMDQLLGKSPDIIVIPFLTMKDQEKFQPVKDWMKKHAETNILTICGGSGNLATTGLLNGKAVATHWQNRIFGVVEKEYPETKWVWDQRYTQSGNIVSSAGVSSGIDAVLYVISQRLGEPVATKIAAEMKYPSYHYVKNPEMDPFAVNLWTYTLNNAFYWNKKKAGVLLYNGIEELALTSVFDIYSDTGTTKALSIASSEQPIVTKHGLTLIPRVAIEETPKLDKLIVPGREAKTLAAADLKLWNEKGNAKEIRFVHSDAPDRFLFEAAIEDLAKQEDLLIAEHAVRRLEFRADEMMQLEGKPFSIVTYSHILFTVLLALFVGFCLDRRFIMKKAIFKGYKQAS